MVIFFKCDSNGRRAEGGRKTAAAVGQRSLDAREGMAEAIRGALEVQQQGRSTKSLHTVANVAAFSV